MHCWKHPKKSGTLRYDDTLYKITCIISSWQDSLPNALWQHFWESKSLEWSPVFKNPKIQKKTKKSKNLTNLDFNPESWQKIEKMLISNSRYRGIVVVEMLILLSRYRGIVAIQGNYPQKCCHNALYVIGRLCVWLA